MTVIKHITGMGNTIRLKIILIVILMHTTLYAQFGNRIMLEDTIIGITDIQTGDLNNDGLKDIVVALTLHDNISYYLNLGDGNFGRRQTLVEGLQRPRTIALSDFNNDGWLDVATASLPFNAGAIDTVFVFYNNAGNGFTASVIDTNTQLIGRVYQMISADVDNNGHMDILAMADAQMFVYYNSNNGHFSKTVIPPGINTENYVMDVGDVNNDGYVDLLIGGVQPIVYMNTNGSLSYDSVRTQTFGWTGLIFALELNDFDNDGDIDLLLKRGTPSDISWYENNGTGIFSFAHTIVSNIPSCGGCTFITATDVNQDGMSDVLATFSQTGKVVWYENQGQGIFGQENIIAMGTVPFVLLIRPDDLTNNGADDVIWAEALSVHLNNTPVHVIEHNDSDQLRFYPNPTGGNFTLESSLSGILCLYDKLGKLVVSDIPIIKGDNRIHLDIPPDVYIVVVKNRSSFVTKKLIIQ